MQWESFDGGEDPMNSKDKVDKTTWERFETVDHAMRVLKLEVFKLLLGFLENGAL